MKILCTHAHFDDYEFVTAGTFELWKRKLGNNLRARLLICTDGRAGHHFRSREETGLLRRQEQQASAQIGGYELEVLTLPDGSVPREACLQSSPDLLAAFWKSLRAFEPDYLFCPPLPSDPLAGVHVDHVGVAESLRKVAYMLNVPHAFTPEYPNLADTPARPHKTPVILHLYDAYMAGNNAYDLAVDIEPAFDLIAEMSFCHQSQISEWIPWVGRHDMNAPVSLSSWKDQLRQRFLRRNREMAINGKGLFEFFVVTAWGQVPDLETLVADFPALSEEHSHLDRLGARLRAWRG